LSTTVPLSPKFWNVYIEFYHTLNRIEHQCHVDSIAKGHVKMCRALTEGDWDSREDLEALDRIIEELESLRNFADEQKDSKAITEENWTSADFQCKSVIDRVIVRAVFSPVNFS
jgi:hypothetical protein